MGRKRKSRSVNKQYSYINEVVLSKDGESTKRSNSRKRKPFDMLGPWWSKEDLICFYEAYRKHGRDWENVAGAVQNRSVEMVEALYTMNKAYLSLPEGAASVDGLIALMSDHYFILGRSASEQETNDGAESSRKPQKRACGKVQPTTYKAHDIEFISHSEIAASKFGCLSLLKKHPGGSWPHPVGKRTPRFPVSVSYKSSNGKTSVSPTSQGLNVKTNVDEDDIAHEIAKALIEVSQRCCSPLVSQAQSGRAGSVMLVPFGHTQIKGIIWPDLYGHFPFVQFINCCRLQHSVADLATDMDEEDSKGRTESVTGDLSACKLDVMKSGIVGTAKQKGRKLKGKKFEADNNSENHLDDIKEERTGKEEGRRSGTIRSKFGVEIADAKFLRSSIQNQRKKSKKGLFGRDEGLAFEALHTLADLSLMMSTKNEDDEGLAFEALNILADLALMMPTKNEDKLMMQSKDEDGDHVDESRTLEALPANQQRDKCRSKGVGMKGHQPISSSEVASSGTSKPGKVSVFNVNIALEENRNPLLSLYEARKSQKMSVSQSERKEACTEIHLGESPGAEKQLSSCLSNHRARRWSTYEWFYSATGYPWFAKSELVEHLYLVGLGHVPRLTRAE